MKNLKKQDGISFIEYAITLPILLTFFFGFYALISLFRTHNAIANIGRIATLWVTTEIPITSDDIINDNGYFVATENLTKAGNNESGKFLCPEGATTKNNCLPFEIEKNEDGETTSDKFNELGITNPCPCSYFQNNVCDYYKGKENEKAVYYYDECSVGQIENCAKDLYSTPSDGTVDKLNSCEKFCIQNMADGARITYDAGKFIPGGDYGTDNFYTGVLKFCQNVYCKQEKDCRYIAMQRVEETLKEGNYLLDIREEKDEKKDDKYEATNKFTFHFTIRDRTKPKDKTPQREKRVIVVEAKGKISTPIFAGYQPDWTETIVDINNVGLRGDPTKYCE